MRILVIQQKRIGDVLTSTIICNSLKKQYPKFKRNKLLDMLSKDFHKSQDNPMYVFKIQKQKEILRQQLMNDQFK